MTANEDIHRLHSANAAGIKKSATHLTVRNLPSDVSRALAAERRRRGKSLNQIVIELLSQSLGIGARQARSNGLRRLAGTWDVEEHARFAATLQAAEQIDEDLWH